MGEFSEDRNESVLRVDIYAEFVRAASEVLHECAQLCIIRLNDRDIRSPVSLRAIRELVCCGVYRIAGNELLLAQLEDNTLRCALGEPPNRIRGTLEAARTLREVVIGVRPNTSKMLGWCRPTSKSAASPSPYKSR